MDRAVRLRELDDAAHDARGGIEILGAAVHRDARAARDRHPLERQPARFGKPDRRGDAVALFRPERAHAERRIREHDHALHALGHFLGGRADDAEHDRAAVTAIRANDAQRASACVQIPFFEGSDRQLDAARRFAVRAGEHAHDLVRVDEPAAAGLDHLALVLRGGPQRVAPRFAHLQREVRAGDVRDHEFAFDRGRCEICAVERAQPHDHLLEPEVARGRRELAREAIDEARINHDFWREMNRDAVPLQAALGIAQREVITERARRLEEQVLERRHVQRRFAPRVGRARAQIAEHEHALVARFLAALAPERVEALGCGQPLEGELREPLQIDPARRFGMDRVETLVLAEADRRRHEGVMRVRAAGPN